MFNPAHEAKAERAARNAARAAQLKKYLQIGDVLTHTRCGGEIEEHRFSGWSGSWLCGTATADTVRINDYCLREANDIAPCSVLYVNRLPVGCLEDVDPKANRRRGAGIR